MFEKIEKRKKLRQKAEENTHRNAKGEIVAAQDDVWREKIRVYMSVEDVKRIIGNEGVVYAQILCIRGDYFDFEKEAAYMIAIDVDENKLIASTNYYEVFYPYYRQRDLTYFKNKLKESEENAS